MPTIGSFSLVKNEARWIAAHLLSWLPVMDEMVFFDGNSTDGTMEIIEAVAESHPRGNRIRLFKDKDPKDLAGDYERMFNECLHSVQSDYATFIHPDMMLRNPSSVPALDCDSVALTMDVRSFAGEPDGKLFQIVGRADKWKNIYRLRNPDLGAHYFGHYGAWNEDVYFSEITGDKHDFHAENFSRYPYHVGDSRLEVLHFSDVRPLERRIGRMVEVLKNNGIVGDEALEVASVHPRVTFKNGDGLSFLPAKYPDDYINARNRYRHLERPSEVAC